MNGMEEGIWKTRSNSADTHNIIFYFFADFVIFQYFNLFGEHLLFFEGAFGKSGEFWICLSVWLFFWTKRV